MARHQVQEAAVHAFDAQLTTGTSQPVPRVVALDGIAEFIGISHGTAGPWPYKPVRIGLHASEGESWILDLTASGSDVLVGRPAATRLCGTASDLHGTASDLHGTASDLLLTLHGRLSPDSLRIQGDRALVRKLLSWPDLG